MIAKALESWFAKVKRPMPWRRRPSPYFCWLSEIMMQQTTYAAVLPYYERFLKRFPTVEKKECGSAAGCLRVLSCGGVPADSVSSSRSPRAAPVTATGGGSSG